LDLAHGGSGKNRAIKIELYTASHGFKAHQIYGGTTNKDQSCEHTDKENRKGPPFVAFKV
jgi:hypothetical protein